MPTCQLGSVAPTELVQTRIALHNAVQVIASAADHLAEPKEDDSHRSMSWESDSCAFRGVPLEGGFSMRVHAVTLLSEVIGAEGKVLAAVELGDEPLVESLLALQAVMPISPERRSFGFHVYEPTLPDPALVLRPLPMEPQVRREELAAYYEIAFQALKRICDANSGASPIRVWPHHFDIATILPGGKKGASIGCGLSPGDQSYAQPYWYLTPYPLAKDATKLKLPAPWKWTKTGFEGIVLPMSEVFRDGKTDKRDAALGEGLDECVEIAQRAIG